MRRTIVFMCIFAIGACPLWGHTDALNRQNQAEQKVASTPEDTYKALQKEYDDAVQEFRKLYSKAETDAEREKLYKEMYPKPSEYFSRFESLAREKPSSEVSLKALSWIVNHNAQGEDLEFALEVLGWDHLKSEGIYEVCWALSYKVTSSAGGLLRNLMRESPHRKVQGQAHYGYPPLGTFRNGQLSMSSMPKA